MQASEQGQLLTAAKGYYVRLELVVDQFVFHSSKKLFWLAIGVEFKFVRVCDDNGRRLTPLTEWGHN